MKITVAVTLQEQLAADTHDTGIKTPEVAESAVPSQFVSLYSKDGARILPRPISLYGIDREKGELRLVYRIAGEGTKEFSGLTANDTTDVLGPLDNGSPLKVGKKAFLVGRGIGVPPMLELTKVLHELNKDGEGSLAQSVLGYRDSQIFLEDEFGTYGLMYMVTEDGSLGTSESVLDAAREQGPMTDVIYARGPTPMLRALKAYTTERGLKCWPSLEEKMACGVGACLVRMCRSKEVDDHPRAYNKRICKDDPMFRVGEIGL